jgi:hypothetical protein
MSIVDWGGWHFPKVNDGDGSFCSAKDGEAMVSLCFSVQGVAKECSGQPGRARGEVGLEKGVQDHRSTRPGLRRKKGKKGKKRK